MAIGTVVLLNSDTIGHPDDELGAMLMRAFLGTLVEAERVPDAVVCLNGGVRLVAQGSPVLRYLQQLQEMGVRVLACGTCLDWFHLKDKLGAGAVTNMADVVDLLAAARSVIRP